MCKEELICDFAEVYHIYDIFSFPSEYIAILANGLDSDSRTKRKIGNQKIRSDIYLLSLIADLLNGLIYGLSDPDKRGKLPDSILAKLLDEDLIENSQTFNTPEEFRAAWKEIVG